MIRFSKVVYCIIINVIIIIIPKARACIIGIEEKISIKGSVYSVDKLVRSLEVYTVIKKM